MDQCLRCTVYGDYEQCKVTPCGKHEDWIVEHLTAALTSAKEEIERLREQERATEKERRYWYDLTGIAESSLASERKETERLREPYRVSVQKMVESGDRITWWVCLDRPDRPKDAKPWDKGRITPYMSKDKKKADFTASEWAEFLGTEVVQPPQQEEQ